RGGNTVNGKRRKVTDTGPTTRLAVDETARIDFVTAVALDGRTAVALYARTADWYAIARPKDHLGATVPGLGNGDIFAAEDALDMMATTGCDGVVIGRGCQGRPWLFGDLANALNGSQERHRPGLAEVGRAVYKHGQYL